MLDSILNEDVREGIGKVEANPYKRDGKVLVSKVRDVHDLKEGILKCVNLIGGFNKIIDEEILLKPNFNTADPPPGSSDPDFVKAVIELLYEHGASKVILGEHACITRAHNCYKRIDVITVYAR